MSILTRYEPQKVLYWFEQLCAIPHGSYNTKQISDFVVSFARERGLRWIQDAANNVLLFAPGTPGCEDSPPVILQGHLDMVCEKEPGYDFDFLTDPLRLRVEDGCISAEGTSLGGDDGIAVAYALALLDSHDIPHPPLEVIFTSDEEVGMLGAAALDCAPLKGRTMINLDSEEEGFLLVSCAGGMTAECVLPLVRERDSGARCTLAIDGLTGGHSGGEIHRGRASANQLLGRLLWELGRELPCRLLGVSGGAKDNAIPRNAAAELLVEPESADRLVEFAHDWQRVLAKEYAATDPGLQVSVRFAGEETAYVLTAESQRRAVCALVNLPYGVQRMSADIPGLVQTSLNLGILTTRDDALSAVFALRSSVGSEKAALLGRLECLMETLGGEVRVSGNYPGWEYRRESPLRAVMTEVFRRLYGREPVVQAIHAGLECGLFSEKLPGLDCVSIGPDMEGIHTAAERLSIASVERTWHYLCAVLGELAAKGSR